MKRKALFTPYTLCLLIRVILSSYGVKELGFLFFLSGSRVTNLQTCRIDGSKLEFSSYDFCMLTVDLETLILCF